MPEIIELDNDESGNAYEEEEPYHTPLTNVSYSIYFRPLIESDREEIERLHEELFPVQYTDTFYDTVVKNLGMDNQPLFSSIALARVEDEESSLFQDSIRYDAWDDLGTHIGVQLNTKDLRHKWKIKENVTMNTLPSSCSQVLQQGNAMIGCVVGTFMEISYLPEDLVEKLVYNPKIHTHMFYIMTLGTSENFRGRGLGTKLIEDCISLVDQVECCGIIYLHVITYNDAAIRLYERLGFYRMERMKGYYTIDDEKYDCYLYAKYTNGNKRSFKVLLYSAYCYLRSFLHLSDDL